MGLQQQQRAERHEGHDQEVYAKLIFKIRCRCTMSEIRHFHGVLQNMVEVIVDSFNGHLRSRVVQSESEILFYKYRYRKMSYWIAIRFLRILNHAS